MQENKYWIWLSRLGVEPQITNNLLKKYKKPEFIYNLDSVELSKNGLSPQNINKILNKYERENLEKYIEYLEKNNIEIVNIYDDNYPNRLKNIYDPPSIIYIKGNKKILNKPSIAIVGCRDCSLYGKINSKYFSKNLSKFGFNIVSGLAKGIDSYAHIGAIEAKGTTIAVVGTGLDMVYPKENELLQEKIIKTGGTIVSEFIIGTKIDRLNFPKRNRIISGISNGVIVVEAKKKSGSFITVDFALEQGKNVYSLPGNITSRTSEGTNNLIKEGAKIVTKIEDILEDFVEKKV